MMVANIIAIAFLVANIISCTHASGWNYDGSDGVLGPDDWKNNYLMCGGTNQSPINIDTRSVSTAIASLKFSGYNESTTTNFTLNNNGHTVQINTNVKTLTVTNQLNDVYVLEQFHFHWGIFNSNGSEHSVNGKFYPLELHLVHFNQNKYNNTAHAASSNDSSALLVLGIFVDVASGSNSVSTALEQLATKFINVYYKDNVTSITPFALEGLLPCSQSTVYTYSGSLTTPGCSEVVNWNVFEQPIYISYQTLQEFRNLRGTSPNKSLANNERPVQPLNGRKVYSYNQSACSTTTETITAPVDITSSPISGTTSGQHSAIRSPSHHNLLLAILIGLAITAIVRMFSVSH